jgi:hypothetical protein
MKKNLSHKEKAPAPSEQRSGRALLQSAKSSGTVGATNELTKEMQSNLYIDTDAAPETQADNFIRVILRIISFDFEESDLRSEPIGYLGKRFFIRATPNDAALLLGGNVQGIQSLVAEIGRRNKRDFKVSVDEKNPKPGIRQSFPVADLWDEWPKEEFRSVVEYLLSAAFKEFSVQITESYGKKSSLQIFTSSQEKEDTVNYVGGRIKTLLKTIGYRFHRKVDVSIERDQMLYEQVAMEMAAA